MSIVGLDIGTTGCKAILFNTVGGIQAQSSREYNILTPHPHWAEQNAEQVWQLAWETLQEVVHTAKKNPPVALALSVQGEAIIPVDAQGIPLRNAILGMDTRTTEENNWLSQELGADNLFNLTGMPVHTINTLPKLLWLQKNEPDVWKRAAQFLLYEDFFIRRLTGKAVISHCLASRTQMYDLQAGQWATDLLAHCKIEPKRLAKLAPPSGGAVGMLRDDLADELGLKTKVLVAAGGHDQACAALGSGVIQAGLAMVSTGTAEVVEVAMKSPALNQKLREGKISVYRHVVPELYLAMTLNHSGGLLLRWFRDQLCQLDLEHSRNSGTDAYDAILAGAPPGPTDLMVLPHFAGAGTPLLDTTSKGAILGLTFSTTKATLAKAILEGLTFELRLNLDLLRDSGIQIQQLHAVGGGAKSSLWLQLKTNICQVPLVVPKVTEAACLGAALLAAQAAGLYTDLTGATRAAVTFPQQMLPEEKAVRQYEPRFQLYQQLYPLLIDFHRQC